ncbi:MAG: hypothetical protein V3V00_13340 [Saprospiraceae bacterium]
MKSSKRKCILILGPHRSGTSAISGCLQKCGLSFGGNLLSPSFDNPKGFFENPDIIAINDALLESEGFNWHSVAPLRDEWWKDNKVKKWKKKAIVIIDSHYSDLKKFAIKDPRFSLTLPFWNDLLQNKFDLELLVILIIRNPMEASASLQKRNLFCINKADKLTVHYILNAERLSRNINRRIISFNDVIDDPNRHLIPIIQDFLNVAKLKIRLDFIDNQLLNSTIEKDNLQGKYQLIATDIYNVLTSDDEKKQKELLLDQIFEDIKNDTSFYKSTKIYLPKNYPYFFLTKKLFLAFANRPLKFIQNFNMTNFRTLFRAIKEEKPSTIINNLKKLLNQ